jgi:Uma2 family endonuclease
MTAAQILPKLSASEYLVWEAQQSERHCFVDGEVFAMSGGTSAHSQTISLSNAALVVHLKGSPCKVFNNDMKLAIAAANAYYYPDVMVSCDARDLADRKTTQITSPKLIVEVLSTSSGGFDRGQKFSHYRTLASLEEYVLIDPDLFTVEVYRKNTSDHWTLYPSDLKQPTVTLKAIDWVGTVQDFLGTPD